MLAGVGLITHPGGPPPADESIVVVRGGATPAPVARAVPAGVGVLAAELPAARANAGAFGDPGIWATPAEFAPPEPAD